MSDLEGQEIRGCDSILLRRKKGYAVMDSALETWRKNYAVGGKVSASMDSTADDKAAASGLAYSGIDTSVEEVVHDSAAALYGGSSDRDGGIAAAEAEAGMGHHGVDARSIEELRAGREESWVHDCSSWG